MNPYHVTPLGTPKQIPPNQHPNSNIYQTQNELPEPQLDPIPLLYLSHIERVTAARAFWRQHSRILEHYLTISPHLPAQLAVKDEKEIVTLYQSSAEYKNAAAALLSKLKKKAVYPPNILLAIDANTIGNDLANLPNLDGLPNLDMSSNAIESLTSTPTLSELDGSQTSLITTQLPKKRTSTSETTEKTASTKITPSLASEKLSESTKKRKTMNSIGKSEPINYDAAYMWIFEDDQVIQYGFPTFTKVHSPIPPSEKEAAGPGIVRTCDRCSRKFTVSNSPNAEECSYHRGRLQVVNNNGEKAKLYSCCQNKPGSNGCTRGVHVWKEERLNHLHSEIAFEVTPEKCPNPKRRHTIIALDCEMVCRRKYPFFLSKWSLNCLSTILGSAKRLILQCYMCLVLYHSWI
jgi:hypothetical protein